VDKNAIDPVRSCRGLGVDALLGDSDQDDHDDSNDPGDRHIEAAPKSSEAPRCL
jgi:hypothetical protein